MVVVAVPVEDVRDGVGVGELEAVVAVDEDVLLEEATPLAGRDVVFHVRPADHAVVLVCDAANGLERVAHLRALVRERRRLLRGTRHLQALSDAR